VSDLWSYLPGGGWPRFCCDVFWQSTFVGLLAWGLLRLAARRPALQAWLALLALTSALAVPVGSAVLRCGGYGLVARAEPNVIAESSHPPVASIGASASSVLARQDGGRCSVADAEESVVGEEPLSWWTLAGIAWAAVSLFFGRRFLLSLVGLRRLQAGAVVCRDQAVVAHVQCSAT
jgi:hypothetical protein